MDKWTVSRILSDIAAYIELGEPNPYRARAYERAAREIEKIEEDIEQLVDTGKIYETRGIGKAIGQVVEEIVRDGKSRYLDELRAQYPPGVFEMLRIPGLGLRKIGQLYSELGISSVEELEAAARAGKLAKVRGFGAKTQQKVLESIAVARTRASQFLLPAGLDTGEMLRQRLAEIDVIEDAEISGSVRRRLEVIRNVDIAVAASDVQKAIAAIGRKQLADQLHDDGSGTITGVVRNEMEVRFHLTTPDDFGALLLATTGSGDFLAALEKKIAAAGYALRNRALYQKGRHVKARTEEALFEKFGVPFVEPEQREDGEQLRRKKRARLIEPADLRGTFHVHTTYSDGRNSILEMLKAAKSRGFEYIGISDHSKSAYYAGGVTEERLIEQHAEIDRHRDTVAPMRVFRGTEADILVDGSIDYGAETLAKFDFVIASIHSRFGMSRDEMTERILRAIDDPFVTFIGHLTGRLLLSREGYSVEFDRIFERAGEREVMIEINGNPRRLDLDWRHIRRALDRGVVLSIHPDAHSIAEMRHITAGTWVARKAGLTNRELFNARPLEEVEEFLRERRKRALSFRA